MTHRELKEKSLSIKRQTRLAGSGITYEFSMGAEAQHVFPEMIGQAEQEPARQGLLEREWIRAGWLHVGLRKHSGPRMPILQLGR